MTTAEPVIFGSNYCQLLLDSMLESADRCAAPPSRGGATVQKVRDAASEAGIGLYRRNRCTGGMKRRSKQELCAELSVYRRCCVQTFGDFLLFLHQDEIADRFPEIEADDALMRYVIAVDRNGTLQRIGSIDFGLVDRDSAMRIEGWTEFRVGTLYDLELLVIVVDRDHRNMGIATRALTAALRYTLQTLSAKYKVPSIERCFVTIDSSVPYYAQKCYVRAFEANGFVLSEAEEVLTVDNWQQFDLVPISLLFEKCSNSDQ